MILRCSQCSTRYVVQAASIPAAGRKVKCARCEYVWHQDPASAEEQEIEITPQPQVITDIPAFSNVPAFKIGSGECNNYVLEDVMTTRCLEIWLRRLSLCNLYFIASLKLHIQLCRRVTLDMSGKKP